MTRAKNHKAPQPVSFTTYLERQEYMQRVMCTSIAAVLKVTMLALAFRCNVKTKQCNPSQETLAQDTGSSIRSVERNIAELKQVGLLRIKQSGDGQSAYYTLFEPPEALFQHRHVLAGLKAAQKAHSAPPRAGGPVQPRQKGGSAPPRVGGQTVEQKEGGNAPTRAGAPDPQEQTDAALPLGVQVGAAGSSNEASAASSIKDRFRPDADPEDGRPSAAPLFAEFEKAYPKKTGMNAARVEFLHLCDGWTLEDPLYIIARAKLYAKDFEGERARYAIPAKQWLHDRCFNDPLPDGVTINNDTGEIELVQPRQPQRNGYRNPLYEQMERLKAKHN